MKSRGAKGYYQPSCSKSISKKKNKTTSSPVHSNPRSSSQLHTLCPETQQRFAATDEQPVFAESWPSTECGSCSSSTTTSSDMETPKPQYARAGQSTDSLEVGVQQDSVLAKYIDRFRHGQPQSREERQQSPSADREKQHPFWWMSPSSLPCSSTPTKTIDQDGIQPLKDDYGLAIFSPAGQHQHNRFPSPCRGSLSMLSDISQGEFDDTEIQDLQQKAGRLLLRGECTSSDGSVPVSSEGLECSDVSSPVSVYEPVRRPLIRTKASTESCVIPPLVPPARREEDILFQWRLRRKIEQAREGSQSLQHSSLQGPTFNWQAPSLSHPSDSGQVYKQHQSARPPEFSQQSTAPHITARHPQTKEAHISCPQASDPSPFPTFVVSGSSVSQPQAIAHVPAHMHLLCDVLPCPMQSSGTHQHLSESTDEPQNKVACKKTRVPGNLINTFTDEHSREHMSYLLSASSEATERAELIHNKRSERNKKEKAQTRKSGKNETKTATSFRKQKKSTRCTVDGEHVDGPGTRSFSHPKVPKIVQPCAEQQQQEGSQEFSSESSAGDHAPPPSPIHTALGQVVSEILFPMVDPSLARRTRLSSVSPPCAASAPPHNSMEVISQLLQEAEDSDEKEFEDDALLLVLRKQRKWVKEQISDVDSKLIEFLEEQHVT
ncbi:proline and serine-rich protein 3 isoform X2 [Pseudoliparis swirei]|uniref:proline and serine-rich protein 3 isoform X2 n=1 Tax=Pseudoliparis swirei TaxID=2059687 RepID=UPI0024BED9F5|nr:proline and serine-rich protein 3 isoform X2 [Pseudoliparis swirei]